ncbi:putative Ig domain-containing protein [Bryocella elongata]|nr:putative Ig domain-containing protein [Bryocella elongata]
MIEGFFGMSRGIGRAARWGVWVAVCALALVITGCGSGITNPVSGQGTPVSIQTLALPSASVGVAYSAAILAQDGTTPYTFTLASGSLPAGLTLATSGVISGTPTAVSSNSFVVQVKDAAANVATATLNLTVSTATPPTIQTSTLAAGTVGTAYTATITAAGGTAPYTFTQTAGTLPAGLSLSTTGVLSGTPTTTGSFTFSVMVTDKAALTATASFTVTIAASSTSLSIATATLPGGTVGATYSATLSAVNGTAPYTYAVSSGSLPAGLSLSTAGVLSGTPTTLGSSTFTVKVTDSTSATASASFTVTIGAAAAGLSITTSSLAAAQENTPYQATIVATGGTAPYSFAVTSGTLPSGLNLSSAGVLTGTPTSAGIVSITITATDAQSKQASATFSLAVNAASTLAITTTTLPNGTYSVAYSAAITASGGTAPYSFAITGGQIPAGLTLTSAGVLSGTPIVGTATSTFSITVTDAVSSRASAVYSVYIGYTGPAAIAFTSTSLPTALVNTAYTTAIGAGGGTTPYTFSITSGTLPTGMSMSSAGVISGTATTVGSYPITVKATDTSSPQGAATANLTLIVSTVSATVSIDATKTLLTVPTNFYGLHTSVYDTSLNDTANLPALLAKTGVTVLRYPGGTYSDSYHWAQYAITPFFTSTAPACGVLANGSLSTVGDFGNFVKLVKAAGTQAMITVNYGTSVSSASGSKTIGSDGQKTCSEPNSQGQPEEAAAWVAYANGSTTSTQVIGVDVTGFDWKTVGYWASMRAASPLATDDGYNFLRLGLSAPVGIKYWEIGNELYYNGWATNHNAESDNHAPYVYPSGYTPGGFNSRNAVDALSPTSYGTNAVQWIDAMKAVDPTIQIGVDFSSPIATDPIPANWNPDLAKAVCAGTNIDFAIMHYYPGTYLNVQASELLSRPQVDIPNVYANIMSAIDAYCPANAASVKVYLTETSPNGPLATSFPQPALGLFTLNDQMSALKSGIGTMEWLEMHDGTYLSESETPGPSYYGFQLAHLAAAPGDGLLSATSSSPFVLAWSTTKTTGGEGVLLVNADPSNAAVVSVQMSGATVGSTATEYSYGVSTSQSGGVLSTTTVSVPGATFPVSVPPYTAVLLLLH